MSLQLNDKGSNEYQEFYGRNIDQMPKLIADGRTPLGVAGLMRRRLEVIGTRLQDVWWNNYFDTGDGIVRNPCGGATIALNTPLLRAITPNSNFHNYELVLIGAPTGETFSKRDVEQYSRKHQSEKEVVNNPFWLTFANHDAALLKDYARATFKLAKAKYGYEKNMGIFLANPDSVPTVRPVYVGDLDYNRSAAYGNGSLGNSYGRLVGVSAGGAVARDNSTCEKIVAPTLEQIITTMKEYVAPTNINEVRKALEKLYK